jgi:hypothetical protein
MSVRPIVNLDQLEPVPRSEAFAPTGAAAERFDARSVRIGPRIGARLLGYNVTAAPPGKAAFHLHARRVNEEMFFILDGEGELRLGTQGHPSWPTVSWHHGSQGSPACEALRAGALRPWRMGKPANERSAGRERPGSSALAVPP